LACSPREEGQSEGQRSDREGEGTRLDAYTEADKVGNHRVGRPSWMCFRFSRLRPPFTFIVVDDETATWCNAPGPKEEVGLGREAALVVGFGSIGEMVSLPDSQGIFALSGDEEWEVLL
jgi:hypothetical protein